MFWYDLFHVNFVPTDVSWCNFSHTSAVAARICSGKSLWQGMIVVFFFVLGVGISVSTHGLQGSCFTLHLEVILPKREC